MKQHIGPFPLYADPLVQIVDGAEVIVGQRRGFTTQA